MKFEIVIFLLLACSRVVASPASGFWTYDSLNQDSKFIFIARVLEYSLLEEDIVPENIHYKVDRYNFIFTVETVLKGSIKNSQLSYKGQTETRRPDAPEILIIVGNIKYPPDLRVKEETYFIVFATDIKDGVIDVTTAGDPALSFIKFEAKMFNKITHDQFMDELRLKYKRRTEENQAEQGSGDNGRKSQVIRRGPRKSIRH